MRCPRDRRHWFTIRGAVGMRRPNCDRCGEANPRPLTPEEQAEFDYWVEQGWTRP